MGIEKKQTFWCKLKKDENNIKFNSLKLTESDDNKPKPEI